MKTYEAVDDGLGGSRRQGGHDGRCHEGDGQAELLAVLKLTLPEHLCADRDATDPSNLSLPIERTLPKM